MVTIVGCTYAAEAFYFERIRSIVILGGHHEPGPSKYQKSDNIIHFSGIGIRATK
jgi:hypothetical protein